MIKYRVNGQFLSENGTMQKICSDFFEDLENPYIARKQAIKYLDNFVDLLINDFHIDFQSTFMEKSKIEIDGEVYEPIFKYKLAVEYTIDNIEFYDIDYYGILEHSSYDYVALGLETEFNYYKENNFKYENSKIITYCNYGEWTEGYTEDEPTTFEILNTSVDFENKETSFWWLTNDEKKQLIENYEQKNKLKMPFNLEKIISLNLNHHYYIISKLKKHQLE